MKEKEKKKMNTGVWTERIEIDGDFRFLRLERAGHFRVVLRSDFSSIRFLTFSIFEIFHLTMGKKRIVSVVKYLSSVSV